jgi:hypothetical protein
MQFMGLFFSRRVNAMMDLPPAMQERVVCSITASVKYDVPANIVLAVAELENGKPDLYRSNGNGSQDIGTMQFNTSYLVDLSIYGITKEDVANSGCYPYELATWRIRNHILHDKGDLWTKAANYHSRTPEYNAIYRRKLKIAARRWADWLTQHFNTRVFHP